MSAGWFLLKSLADWDDFRRQRADVWGLDVADVQWGRGPQQYPCLVAAHRLPNAQPAKVLAAYAYPEDAMRLLQAAGPNAQAIPPAPTAPPGMVAVPVGALSASALAVQFAQVKEMLERISRLNASRKEHDRHSAAKLLTIVKILVDTGIIKEDQFEERFNAALAFVDQHGDDKGAEVAARAKLDPGEAGG